MIDTQAIRKKILDLALRGKLTEQRPEDETAEELYEKIQAEKKMLIKAGKVKKDKPLLEIKSDELPFEIPESWKWVKVGNIGSWSAGSTPSRGNPAYYNNGTIPWLKTGDLCDNYVSEVPESITEQALQEGSLRVNPIGSVLMAMYGATIGKLCILTTPMTTNQACCACIPFTGIYNRYLFYFLLGMRSAFIEKGKGGAQPNISKEIIVNSDFPLPPFPEQRRIVAKIDAIFSLLDTIDALQSTYTANQKALRAKLIDAAIRGQLTEQLPEDGTAEELYQQIHQEKLALEKAGKIKKSKPLPPISDEEKPFDIPENWKWVRFDVISNILGTGMIRAGNEQYNEAEYYYFKMNNIGNFDGKCHFENLVMVNASKEEFDRYKLEEDDFLFNTRNSKELVGKTAVVPPISQPIILNNNILKIHFLGGIVPKYINYYFLSTQGHTRLSSFVTSTTNVAAIYQRQLITFCVPLPPLAEQKRIVAKLEELLPLCKG